MTEFEHFINLATHEGLLHREEIEVILAVLDRILSGLEQKLKTNFIAGTIILDGQPFGEEASCIFHCNVGEGAFLTLPCLEQDSDQCARESIDEFLAWPDNQYSVYRYQLLRTSMPPTSGVYSHKRMRALVLNMMTGRFVFAALLYTSSKVEVEKVELALMRACTRVIRALFPDDFALGDYLSGGQQIHRSSTMLNQYVVRTTRDLLEKRSLPAIERWWKWRQSLTTELLPFMG